VIEKAVWDAPWPWPLSAIEDWAKNVVNTILGWIRSATGWVYEMLRAAWDWVLTQTYTLVLKIRDRLETLAGEVAGALRTALDGLRAAWDGILRGTYDLASRVWGKMASLAQEVADRVASGLRAMWSGLEATISRISDAAGKIREWMEAAGGAMGAALGRVADLLEAVGAKVMDALGSVLSGLLHGILDFLGAIASKIWDAIKVMASKVEEAFSWVADRIKSLLSSIWETLVKLRPEGPEDVPTKLPQLIAALGLAGVGTFLALDVAGLKIMGSGVELDGLKNYLKDVFSPGLVQGVLIGAILSQGYGPFIGRWVRSTFRTWLPEPTEAYVMWRQGYITEGDLRSILAQHGTPEKWMAGRIDLCDYTPGMRELLTVGQYTDLDLEWLTGKLKENGVAPKDEAKYQELFTQMSLRRVHTEIWSAIYTAISYGVPPRDAVDGYLTDAKLRAYLRPYYLMAYDIRLNTSRVRWWLDAYEEQVYRGLVEPEAALEKMLGLGVDKSYAMARIAYQMARRGILWEPPTS
jgi:hypothetical protein